MAVELTFSKEDVSTNWGFRLVGGSDFDQPLIVVKVNGNSLAEDSGLQVGDVIVRVNNTPTAGLTHTEVHELITSSGLQFTLGVLRGDSPINIIHDEDYNFGFKEILKGVQISVDEDIIDQASDIVERLNRENSRRNQQTITTSKNKNRKEKMVFSNTAQTDFMVEETSEDKKWSTFLMKPNKPIPQPKKTLENIPVKSDPYKVVIKKQGSRRKLFSKEKRVQFDETIAGLEPISQPVEVEKSNYISDDHEEFPENGNTDANFTEDGEDDNEELIGRDENQNVAENEDYTNYEYQQEDPVEIAYKPLSEIKVDDSESSMTLEEQLLAVQKQLQALSQLPSAIQLTLDAVSRQLASIVSAKESSQEKEAKEKSECEEGNDESISMDDEAEAEVTRPEDEDTNSTVDEEFEDDYIAEEEIKAILDRARIEEGVEEEEEEVVGDDLTEEEKEAIMKEEQLEAKKEKDMEDFQARPKTIQRPIILPGGRKWSNPEDAIPSFRKPKMSEEKIIETIESNLEPIVGKRKGINFLKYQPPPKNLDYLQRSEVYRLVHDMEPPVRGIVSRPEKILPEQDYYEATKGAP
nr:eukaryotic translation initiation factor 5B-like isoform X1 [Leptinotarsa decemlineata]